MQEWKCAVVNGREVPVLISDEKEALLAAKAAGRAIVGLWRPGQEMDEISAAKYVVESLEDVTGEYLERAARRHLGLPWRICESERLLIREMFASDFDEVWSNQVGHGFGTIEELEAYTKHQYEFYEFGFWALVEKTSGDLVGMAGLKVPEISEIPEVLEVSECSDAVGSTVHRTFPILMALGDGPGEECLELGYHIFRPYRRQGFAKEACQAILKYGTEELGISRFLVQIAPDNQISIDLAEKLGFKKCVHEIV